MLCALLALPAILRPLVLLASASPQAFSVNDDLFAFPQYEVRFSDDYLTESQADRKLEQPINNLRNGVDSQVGAYQPHQDGAPQSPDGPAVDRIEYKYMMLQGQRYLCNIPHPEKSEATSGSVNETLSRAERDLELARAADRGWELLSSMEGNCVYFISGWWSYRFCYKDGVRQFHQLPPSKNVPIYPPAEDPGVEGFMLGMYRPKDEEPESVKGGSELGELVQRGDSRYLVQRLEGGTKCDLTGRERRIEIQYHCNPQSADRISLIKETSTCAYLMVVQTPRLCNDVAFQPPPKEHSYPISCQPILAEEQVDDFVKDMKALRDAEKEAQVWAANADAAKVFSGARSVGGTVVGDVVIGAHTLVPEDMKLEKSTIVGGVLKETYVDTIASSDGKLMSRDAIEKLGMGDHKAVEKLRERLEEFANGQEWKLNVVDTAQGREYRGVIGKGDDDEKQAEKQKKTKQAAKTTGKKAQGKNEKPAKAKQEENDEEDMLLKGEL